MARMKTPPKKNIGYQLMEEIKQDSKLIGKVKPISLEWVIPNPDNVAATEDTPEAIAELAESIRMNGLLHLPVLNQVGEHQYMILSGERRIRAIKECLIPGSLHGEWNVINCVVYEDLDDLMCESITLSANLKTRQYSAAKKLELYGRMHTNLTALKEQGRYSGGVQSAIAKELGISKSMVSHYQTVVEGLSADELQQVTNIGQAAAEIRRRKRRSPAQMANELSTGCLCVLNNAEVLRDRRIRILLDDLKELLSDKLEIYNAEMNQVERYIDTAEKVLEKASDILRTARERTDRAALDDDPEGMD